MQTATPWITRSEAFRILHRRLEEGYEQLAQYPHERHAFGLIREQREVWAVDHDDLTAIEACFERARSWLMDARNHDHFKEARWACLPAIVQTDVVRLTQHIAWSNRKQGLLGVVRHQYKLSRELNLEQIAQAVKESGQEGCLELAQLIWERPRLIVLRRVPSLALRALVMTPEGDRVINLKHGLVAVCPGGPRILPPVDRANRREGKPRRAVPGLFDVYYLL